MTRNLENFAKFFETKQGVNVGIEIRNKVHDLRSVVAQVKRSTLFYQHNNLMSGHKFIIHILIITNMV